MRIPSILTVLFSVLPLSAQDPPLNLTPGLGDFNEGAAWSPDGRSIAFMSRSRSILNSRIYVVQADGSQRVQLTDGTRYDLNPVWSPDGTRIAFNSRLRDSRESRIYTMAPDGSQIRAISTPIDMGWHSTPAWSPDGTQMAFVVHTPNAADIYVADVESGEIRQITSHPEIDEHPFWSPDGTLGFVSKREGGHGDLFRLLPSGDVENLTNHAARDVLWFFSTAGTNPWSPDGKWILFSSDRDSAIGSGDVYILGVDDGSVRRLTFSRLTEFRFTWAPDSRRIAYDYADEQGRDDLYVLDIESGGLTRVTDEDYRGQRPVWSPDGTRLAYVSFSDQRSDIYVMSADRAVESLVPDPNLVTLDGDVRISSAADLEELLSRGGDAFEIFGTLSIRNTDLVDLTALRGLKGIQGGNLRIQGNGSLVSLEGLEGITKLNELQIISNNALHDVQGLDSLQLVIFNVQITGNRTMKSLHGLESLKRAGRLVLQNNDELNTLSGLDGLEIAGGWPTYALGDLTITGNPSLLDLRGLDALARVDGILRISNNNSLATLAGLEGLRYVQMTLQIDGNPALTNLDGLANLDTLISSFGFNRGSLIISDNPVLTSVQGLAGLSDLNTSLTLTDNAALKSLDGLGGITIASLTVTGCDSLTDLSGLGIGVLVSTVISNNASLQTLTGLDSATTARDLIIEGNPVLNSLEGLAHLGDIHGHLTIKDNPALQSLSGLSALLRVGGAVAVSQNAELQAEEVTRFLQQIGRGSASQEGGTNDDVVDDPPTDDETTVLPTRTRLLPAYPNPSNSTMTLIYDLAESASVQLQLYSLSGQRVRDLVSNLQGAGRHRVDWDGLNAAGVPVAAGIYLVRFRAGQARQTTRQTEKLMLLR